MKIKVFTLILFFALASTATAKEPYFVKTGSQILYYERYDADSNKLMQNYIRDKEMQRQISLKNNSKQKQKRHKLKLIYMQNSKKQRVLEQ